MIGRTVERQQIDNALNGASSGEPTTLTLIGDAGTGKSELVRYATDKARSAQFQVVTLRGDQFDAMVPMTVLSGLVAALGASVAGVAPQHQRALDGVLGGQEEEAIDAFTLAAALVNLLAVAAAVGPVLVAVDDIHWVDPFSAHVIGLSVHRLQAEPVVVMLAGRSVPGELSGGLRLEIGGLSPEESGQLLVEAAPYPPARHVRAELSLLTRGNPLMLAEVARLLTESQLDGSEPLPAPLPIGSTGKAIVAPAIAPLPERTRRALVVVALAGPASHLAVPVALPLLGLTLGDLDAAITQRIVERHGWRFRHPLFAAAVVDTVAPSEVRRMHTTLAAVLADTDVLRHAHHLAAAAGGVDVAAADALHKAAQVAVRRGGVAASAHLWYEAARLSPPGPTRTVRLLEAVDAHTATGQRELAYAGIDELAGARLTLPQLARATRARTALLPWSRTVVRDLGEVDAASAALSVSEPLVAAEICMNLATAGFSIGAGDLVVRQADLAVEYSAGNPLVLFTAHLLQSFALSLFRGVPWQPDITRLDDPENRRYLVDTLPRMSAGLAQGLIWLDEPELSMRLRSEVIDRARADGAVAELPYPLAGSGELAWWTGAWGSGRRDLAEAVELAQLVGHESLLGFAWSLLANFHAAAGRDADLTEALAQAERSEHGTGTTPVRIYVARARLHAALAANRVVDAVGHGADAHAAAEKVGLAGLMQVPYLPEYVEAAVLVRHDDAANLRDELWRVAR